MAHWLVIGTPENWKYSLNHGNTWGFSQYYETKWTEIQIGDTLIYYAMAPIKRLIGHGVVESKTRGDQPFFPSEVGQGRLVWPLQIQFSNTRCLDFEQWHTNGCLLERRGLVFQRALQKLEERRAQQLVRAISRA